VNDHEIALLINEVTAVAREFHDTQQLRERMANLIVPKLREHYGEGFDEGYTEGYEKGYRYEL
jgi:flagellar biosynthesis/type III secretory pathway protein FliH